MSRRPPLSRAEKIPANARVAVVAARFNEAIADALLEGCLQRLEELGVRRGRIIVERVPGAFELPLAAKAMCRSGRYAAVICLGAVIRGQTAHFDYVAGQCARGIAEVGREELMPVIFGVLTTNNEMQARERIGGKHGHAGRRAAEAAVEMIGVMRRAGGKRQRR